MPLSTHEILEFLSQLASDENVKITVQQSFRDALITGAAAGAGGILGGPVGVVIGAIVGSLGAVATGERFQSIFQAFSKMEINKKELLAENIRRIVSSVHVTDVAALTALVSGNVVLKRQIINELVTFLRKEMELTVTM